MATDMTVPCGDGFVNLRVGAIIQKDGKFLMVGNDTQDYLYSVGGRIQFGETAEQAIVREVREETGVTMAVDRLGFVHEDYFLCDLASKRDKVIYEVSFYFYMQVPEDFVPRCSSVACEGQKEFLVWVTPEEERTMYPDFFRTELLHPSREIRHIVTDERPGAGEARP